MFINNMDSRKQLVEAKMDEEKIWTIPEAAERSRMSISWWRQRISAGEVGFLRIGRRVFIPEDTIKKILREGIVEPK